MDTAAEVRARVRSIVTSRWLDANRISIAYSSGTVRMTGTIERLPGSRGGEVRPQLLDTIESEIRRLKGVTHVHMDFTNWTRLGATGWTPRGH